MGDEKGGVWLLFVCAESDENRREPVRKPQADGALPLTCNSLAGNGLQGRRWFLHGLRQTEHGLVMVGRSLRCSSSYPGTSGFLVGKCLTFCRGAWMMEVG
jgi:hypothetical protein